MNNDFELSCILNSDCLACGGDKLRTILDLGNQPLANNYHSGNFQQNYPLKLNLCSECYHLQLSHSVNPNLMFKHYLYVSGTSQTLKNYFDYFAKKTLEYNNNAKSILDIACNDGTQLNSYKNLGIETYGIDPADNLFEISSSGGHKIICDYFNSDTVEKFKDKKFDIITAQNVFAHTRYTEDFLISCKKLMSDDSFLFIQTSQANMIINNEFDTIYHEHLSFFNTNSMKTLVQRCGLVLHDVFKTDIHGTSYVFVIKKSGLPKLSILDFIHEEQKNGLYDILTYPQYSLNCYKSVFNLKESLLRFKSDGYILVGYGAAAKGNTLLNFGKITLDIIIDDNPLKQNLLTPGMNIPIKNSDVLSEYKSSDKIVFVPLAWNFYREILQKIKVKRTNSNDLFIKYFPTFKIEN